MCMHVYTFYPSTNLPPDFTRTRYTALAEGFRLCVYLRSDGMLVHLWLENIEKEKATINSGIQSILQVCT